MLENKIAKSWICDILEIYIPQKLYGILYKLVFYTSFIYIHGLYIHDGSN